MTRLTSQHPTTLARPNPVARVTHPPLLSWKHSGLGRRFRSYPTPFMKEHTTTVETFHGTYINGTLVCNEAEMADGDSWRDYSLRLTDRSDRYLTSIGDMQIDDLCEFARKAKAAIERWEDKCYDEECSLVRV